MISAPSHRLRSSGNNFIFILILFLITGLVACDPTKRSRTSDRSDRDNKEEELAEITGKRKYNPETGKYEIITVTEAKMDTIRWKKIQSLPPIIDFPEPVLPGFELPETDFKEKYKISLLVPFMTDRIDLAHEEIRESYAPPLHFYAGMKLALKEYDQPAEIEIQVVDTRFSPKEVLSIVERPVLASSDLVIGPWRSDNIRIIGEHCLENKHPFVSPLYPSNNLFEENPYHIQVNPSLENHARTIIDFAESRFPMENIVLLERNESALEIFQDAHFAKNKTLDVDSLTEFILPADPEDWLELDFSEYIKPMETTVFVIPSASRSDETFVHDILRQIDLAKEKEEVVVIGMPSWQNFDRISYDYYEKLNVHISTAFYIKEESPNVRKFRRDFYKEYGVLPLDEAFRGYDIMEYFARMVSKHGTQFQYWLDQEQMDVLHTRFEFERIVPADAIRMEDFSRVARFENGYVSILEFEDYDFHPVK